MTCYCCVATLILGVTVLLILKAIFKLRIGWNNSSTCLVGKTAIVTGANTGIGFYTAQDLAKRGAKVILACRNKTKAEQARAKIIKATGNSNVFVKILDLTSLASVRQFAKEINEQEESLHILVNNAGVIGVGEQTTSDGLDLLTQVNHLGPFLLTLLLIDLMKRSKWGRIVNVSSSGAYSSKLKKGEDLGVYPKKERFSDMQNYCNSKLCNVLFTNELARRLKRSCIQTNSLHPGVVDTEIFRAMPSFIKPAFDLAAKLFFKTSEEGAQTSIYLAVSKRVDLIAGEFFDNCKIARMPEAGRSEDLASKLWQKSEELVKLTPEEKLL